MTQVWFPLQNHGQAPVRVRTHRPGRLSPGALPTPCGPPPATSPPHLRLAQPRRVAQVRRRLFQQRARGQPSLRGHQVSVRHDREHGVSQAHGGGSIAARCFRQFPGGIFGCVGRLPVWRVRAQGAQRIQGTSCDAWGWHFLRPGPRRQLVLSHRGLLLLHLPERDCDEGGQHSGAFELPLSCHTAFPPPILHRLPPLTCDHRPSISSLRCLKRLTS